MVTSVSAVENCSENLSLADNPPLNLQYKHDIENLKSKYMLTLTGSLPLSNSEDITGSDKSPFFQSLTLDDSSSALCNNHPTCRDFKSLDKLRIEDSTDFSPDDIVQLVSQCQCLREISVPYSLLSDDLLTAVSVEKRTRLKTMKIEAYSESKPFARISDGAWLTLESQSPNLNLILSSYLSDDDDYEALLTTTVPITHLYLGGYPPETMVQRIGENCPRLVELVVSTYSPGTIDQVLISTAKGCPNLSAVGLGDCEITCSGLVEFVDICKERLRVLYIWETSLIEDTNFDVTQATSKVSSLLGRSWTPEYIPPW